MRVNEQTYFAKPESFMAVRHVTLHGTNFEIGRWLGEMAAERYGRSAADLAANPLYARARRLYMQHNYPIHFQRMSGVAAAFGINAEDDRYDLTGLAYLTDMPLPPFGCSAVYYPPATTANGHGHLSRNYDFSVGTMADIMRVPLPPDAGASLPPAMSEPYIMEWYPADGGYPSLAIHAFDTLAGTLDGINSEGLVVSILADNEALNELGSGLEPHLGPMQVVGLHELAVMRLLLDTCATAVEARERLLTAKQHYRFVPCHYIVADRSGDCFIYENSTGRNVQHVIDNHGQLQVLTNFQLHRHPKPEIAPGDRLTLANEAFWRYRVLTERIDHHHESFTTDQMKAISACVNILNLIETTHTGDSLYGVPTRTIWHSLYDQQEASVEFSFYLGEETLADGTRTERRSDYLRFALES